MISFSNLKTLEVLLKMMEQTKDELGNMVCMLIPLLSRKKPLIGKKAILKRCGICVRNKTYFMGTSSARHTNYFGRF